MNEHGFRSIPALRAIGSAIALCFIVVCLPACAAYELPGSGSTLIQLGLDGGTWAYGNLGILVSSADRKAAVIIEAHRPDVMLGAEWREFDLSESRLVSVQYVECNKDVVAHYVSDALDASSIKTKFTMANSGVVRIRVFGNQDEYGRAESSYFADVEMRDVRIECAGHPSGTWLISDALSQIRVSLR